MRILCASHSPTMRAVLRNIVQRVQGGELESSANVDDAVAMALVFRPSVIIFDDHGDPEELPHLLDLLRTQRVQARVLALTDGSCVARPCNPTQDSDQVPAQATVLELLQKPFVPEQLLQMLGTPLSEP